MDGYFANKSERNFSVLFSNTRYKDKKKRPEGLSFF